MPTLFDKLWDSHVIASLAPGVDLLQVDCHFITEFHSRLFRDFEARGLKVRRPERTFGTEDHLVSTAPGRSGGGVEWSAKFIDGMRRGCRDHGIRLFDIEDPGQGIAHVIGPELGLTQPGHLIVCGDSHTSTHGAFGALAWGIGSSEVMHVLATQTIVQRRPLPMRVRIDGALTPGVAAKDLVLALIAKVGTAGGTGCAVEYAGSAIDALDLEGRMTICNMSIEFGAKIGLIAPDEKAFAWLRDRTYVPKGAMWDLALAYWRGLRSDPEARFEREVDLDAAQVRPQITWGTNPQQTIAVDGVVPDPSAVADGKARAAMQQALAYMDVSPGQRLVGLPIDRVFIGSCTNGRLADLRGAAQLLRGRRVAPHVEAWAVPGSQQVKREAEAEGLDRVFTDAGFQWREPGCSLCLGANGETVAAGKRCVSTSNRNFEGRQGPGARTHLASPVMAAAAAVAGAIVDVREFMS
jgi:3-isopropylmalate/(R)-2-methylmalate dehydratase large subunit